MQFPKERDLGWMLRDMRRLVALLAKSKRGLGRAPGGAALVTGGAETSVAPAVLASRLRQRRRRAGLAPASCVDCSKPNDRPIGRRCVHCNELSEARKRRYEKRKTAARRAAVQAEWEAIGGQAVEEEFAWLIALQRS
jgi:hypothetical protein